MKSVCQHLFKGIVAANDFAEIRVVKLPTGDLAPALNALRSGKVLIVVLDRLDRSAIGRVAALLTSYTEISGKMKWLGEKTFLFAPLSCQISSQDLAQNQALSRSQVPSSGHQTSSCPSLVRASSTVSEKPPQIWREEIGNYLLEMVVLPGGQFIMGSPAQEPERSQDESPQHLVTIASVSMSKYPITQCQWQAVAALPQIERPLDPHPAYFEGANLPVEQVSWYDAVEFCARLSQKTQRQYRLPSEAEWEYAARAGTTTPFSVGVTLSPKQANYDSRSAYGNGVCGEYRQQTTSVGYFDVENRFGLADLHGNVWEWCGDRWHDNYRNAPCDGSAWVSGEEKRSRVIRGGSWYDAPRFCRSACRYGLQPGDRSNDVGFRIVCSSSI